MIMVLGPHKKKAEARAEKAADRATREAAAQPEDATPVDALEATAAEPAPIDQPDQALQA
jgi:translation initiation factor IF-3